nr:hypothetical protein [Candidatus Kerfeldbacteria bacterium]
MVHYLKSIAQHHPRSIHGSALGFLALCSALITALCVVLSPSAAYAATCNIGTSTTFDQSYITTNSCTDVHITGSATITFSGTLDLVGTGIFYVDSGITMTQSGAANFTDSADSFVINGTVTHAVGNSAGVNITVATLTISSTGSINVNSKGCAASGTSNGYGPNGSNVCTVTTAGYGTGANSSIGAGGGGYGGRGGNGSSGHAGGSVYGSALTPALQGSSGGNATSSALGGTGGGLVQLTVSGALTLDGPISANGGNGAINSTNRASGGGSGGAINISAGTLAGSSLSFSVSGGNGGDNTTADGGGGGAGRIFLSYTSGSPSLSVSNFVANGGTATGTAQAGTKGTTYVKRGTSPTAQITIYNGFEYDDTDFLESTFTIDSSATNQTCKSAAVTPSITAGTITINAGMNCTVSTVTSFNLSATSTFTLGSSITWTVSGTGSTVDWNLPSGSYT